MPEKTQTIATGSGNTTLTQGGWRRYLLPLSVAVLVIFHSVGFYGLAFSDNPEYFQQLTPMNLLLTAVLLFSFHKRWNGSFMLFALMAATVGFTAEVLGIHTGLLFGDYSYGAALGLKLWEVPLLIGLNWLILIYSTGHISDFTKFAWPVKAVLGSLLMVLLDLFLEPVAVEYDFWRWHSNNIPLSNFIGWFGVALLLQVLYQWLPIAKGNPMAPFVFLVQLLFFVGLYLCL
ncbi:carotenoid biosynthesis protein [Pontibacter silvestris]|uniref:Carotenoid biosynthesis protein n=1 Tax=Pontibacter silvestris TaxID=2305183 RepID=A0ABW4X1P7_9BACT|nr:carotenoid biosynthesis protein [Pontibacter silvestris]MCC9135726.1 carotenoid biosynthesis protein [Pontibacter silvestris]